MHFKSSEQAANRCFELLNMEKVWQVSTLRIITVTAPIKSINVFSSAITKISEKNLPHNGRDGQNV